MAPNALDFSLSFTYAEEEAPALDHVTGAIPAGKCIVLCGQSGCGKSTLLRTFNRLIPQFYEGDLQGFCHIFGQDGDALSIGETGRLAVSVFQDPRSQFFTLNSDTEVAFGLENFGRSRQEMLPRLEEAFRAFHMEKLRDRNVFSLSSGERQLVAILSAWATDTNLLLLDEPTANLDYTAIAQLTEALKLLKEKGKTLVISEHRLYYLKDIADEYWLMEKGRIKARYPAEELQALSPQELSALGLRTTDLTRLTSALQPTPAPEKEDTLTIDGLHFRYGKTSQEVLRGVSLTARTGEVLGLSGSNGCGKTTLGKLTAGLLKPASGTVSLNGKALSEKELTEQSIFIMQEAEFQFFTNSVFNELAYGQPLTPQRRADMEALLKEAGLWELRDRHPFSLSGGQMQKLVMLLACLSKKPIVVLDEPTAGLDHHSLTVCAGLIRKMQRDKIVLLISHDLELLSMVCTKSIRLDGGQVREVFDLTTPGAFNRLRQDMQHLTPAEYHRPPAHKKPQLDPRLKLLLLLAAMAAGLGTDTALILSIGAVLVLAALWEHNWGLAAGSVGSLLLVNGLYWLWPSVATSFIAGFFPRIILMGTGAVLAVSPREGPRFLAGLRALHVPEKINMIVSVIFRFFPVLHADLAIMSQSIKTRGFFKTLSQKLRSLPEYLEILIVPMVFRVLRIAEALSASAETRGIALSGRRQSYLSIGWKAIDTGMTILLAAAAVIGFIL